MRTAERNVPGKVLQDLSLAFGRSDDDAVRIAQAQQNGRVVVKLRGCGPGDFVPRDGVGPASACDRDARFIELQVSRRQPSVRNRQQQKASHDHHEPCDAPHENGIVPAEYDDDQAEHGDPRAQKGEPRTRGPDRYAADNLDMSGQGTLKAQLAKNDAHERDGA